MTEIEDYATTNEMEINVKKTKVMTFNQSRRKIDFMPNIILGNDILNVVDEMKLVGVVVSSNLKWKANTEYITKRGFSKLWL